MSRVLIVLVATLAATSARAWDDIERMSTAQAIGSVLAAESFCELTYDHAAVAAHVEETVPADDMEFAGMLQMMTEGARYRLEDMTGAQKAAHCAQTRRVAASYGFSD